MIALKREEHFAKLLTLYLDTQTATTKHYEIEAELLDRMSIAVRMADAETVRGLFGISKVETFELLNSCHWEFGKESLEIYQKLLKKQDESEG